MRGASSSATTMRSFMPPMGSRRGRPRIGRPARRQQSRRAQSARPCDGIRAVGGLGSVEPAGQLGLESGDRFILMHFRSLLRRSIRVDWTSAPCATWHLCQSFSGLPSLMPGTPATLRSCFPDPVCLFEQKDTLPKRLCRNVLLRLCSSARMRSLLSSASVRRASDLARNRERRPVESPPCDSYSWRAPNGLDCLWQMDTPDFDRRADLATTGASR